MNEGDITITITESQHEFLISALNHVMDSMYFAIPYGLGVLEIPEGSEIAERFELLENLYGMLLELWTDRFKDVPVEEMAHGHVRKDLDTL